MYIGIDIGTSSVKVLAINAQGKSLGEASAEYPLSLPKENWAEQNPKDWMLGTKKALKDLSDHLDLSQVKSLAFSGQMHGLVALDKADRVLRPAILWCDGRSQKQVEALKDNYGWDRISTWTGNIAFAGFTAPKILWMKENENHLYQAIDKVMLPKDYMAYKMSGVFASDYSDSSGTLYLNVKQKKWSEEMVACVGLKEENFPKLVESYESLGTIVPEMAEVLGLPKTTQIVIGGGDQACGAVGGGIVKSNVASISLGTSGVVFASSDAFIKDTSYGLHSFCHANGKYHMMGCMLTAAGALKWWVETIHGKGLNKTQKDALYDVMLEEARQAKIDNGLYFLPYLMGERSPHNDPSARGTFVGLSMRHTRGDMTRSLLEGVAFGLKDAFELMSEQGLKVTTGVITGGGARSPLWRQIIADSLNLPLYKLKTEAGPAYGAAILAAVGDGAYKTVESACEAMIQTDLLESPIEENVQAYGQKYKVFTQLYPALKTTFQNL